MEKTLSLATLFQDLAPPGLLSPRLAEAEVLRVDIDAAQRRVDVSLRPAEYIPIKSLRETAHSLERTFSLRELRLTPSYRPDLLETMDFSDLTQILLRDYPPASATLAGAGWRLDGSTLQIRLRANGKAALAPHLPVAERYLRERFGREIAIEIESGGLPEDADLFAETARIRAEAVAHWTPPAPREERPKREESPVQTDLIYGKPFQGPVTSMDELSLDMPRVIVEGAVFGVDNKELKKRNAWIVNFNLTDNRSSIRVKQFLEAAKAKPLLGRIANGMYLRVQGRMNLDRYDNELTLQPLSIMAGKAPQRQDTAAGGKRVELHLHTSMSNMDALTNAGDAVKAAARWGHRAIAITDHGCLQAYPDAMHAAEKAKVAGSGEPIKILYGLEAYFYNDLDPLAAVHGPEDFPLEGEFVAFDLETTGLSSRDDEIIEFGAVVWRNGKPGEEFQAFVNPGRHLSPETTDLTGITDADLRDAPGIGEVLPKFLEFCAGRPLAAHNALFDVGFVKAACKRLGIDYRPTYLDTLPLAQRLLPDLGRYKLNLVADALELPAFRHHRAVDDARTVGYMLPPFARMLAERGITRLSEINPLLRTLPSGAKLDRRDIRHLIIFAKNQTGLRNLYRLVSYSNLRHYKYKRPLIPKSDLEQWREGLLLGSACEAGELFQAVVAGRDEDELLRLASFYDFLEIQPLANNRFMLAKGLARDDEQLRDFNRAVVHLGRLLDKPVVATGDVHFLNPEDEIFRRLLLASKGFEDCDRENPLYFHTTDEMLSEFSYLGPDAAREVVVDNPNRIADMCETLRPVPYNLFAPSIENSEEDLKALVYGKLERLYGKTPPELIVSRVETELHDIISCHYDVIYMSAQKLVQNSLENGYLVGSRGSVGSSLVAFLSGITEVNSLPPHYRCPKCKYCSFDVPEGRACGADLPDAVCPECGEALDKDGFNIPFETFLGFGGDKVPDIDLNFSGEYQSRAHAYCVELFGASHVFRAGTIGTVAEKTAFGYVKKYLDERGKTASKAEETRLAGGCVGVKRTTGQHPGGLVVIPQENEIWDFCPVQHPADDPDSDIITTHFEYHCMEDNLLKLDMLGHDDPTMIRMMEDLTHLDATKIPLDDQDTMSIFTSSKILGFADDPLLGPVGTCAIPEFGTSFTRGMLVETQPHEFDILVRLSGFSHGTDVWLGNARDLVLSGTASVKDAIGCRDDIMLYLIKCGMPEKRSFKIMEAVRKGRGLPEGAEDEMREAGVPEWYIGSCKKIKYLFPKAHAVAYVMMAFRIAWFKVHQPLAFYAAYFYRRSQKGAFDAAMMCHGIELVRDKIKEINDNPDATDKDDDLKTTLEVCYEFYLRGFDFLPMDLYESEALKFGIVDGDKLLPPFVAVSGLGEAAAWDITEGRKNKRFLSVEEFSAACPKVSKTHIENLKAAGAFGDLPDSSQMSLFGT